MATEAAAQGEAALDKIAGTHLAGAAGSGKTFVGVHLILEKLRAYPDANVLFAAQTHGLVLFVAKWFGQRATCTAERDSILAQLHFMYALHRQPVHL